MESEDGYPKSWKMVVVANELVPLISCVQCKKTGLFTFDAVFMLHCNDCFVDKKVLCKVEWFTKVKKDLLPCEVCLKSYKEEKRLVVHSCKREGIDSCEHCGQQFYSRKSMKKHCKIVHNSVIGRRGSIKNTTDKFQFDKQSCSDSFTQNSSLPILPQKDEKPYQCTTCSMSFKYNSHLLDHIRCHTGEKPYQCPTCSKGFTRKHNLHNHIRCHKGEKPYQCPICIKSFALKSNLHDHIRYHTGEKPYQCPTCSKSFTKKFSLNRHIRSHTVE